MGIIIKVINHEPSKMICTLRTLIAWLVFLAIYPDIVVATSALWISRTLSVISWFRLSNYSSRTIVDWTLSGSRSSSQKLIFSLISDRQDQILSEFKTSLKLTRNLPPLLCLYWGIPLSIGSLCRRAVITYIYPSLKSSSINIAWERSVVVNADAVCVVSVKWGDWNHFSIQLARAL